MPDVDITCIQCKLVFNYTEKEQQNFYERNMMTPQRCQKCRSKKAAKRPDAPNKYEIVCDHCGKQDTVPFQPKTGRQILCQDCFQASRSRAKAS